MPQQERSQLKAGLFILFSIALIFGVIVAIKGVRVVFTPVDQRQIRFNLSDDVGGLRIGDDVRIGGFKVGVVRQIELQGLSDAGAQPSLLITFSIPRKYALHEDAHVAIQTTVTGTSVLNIDNVGTGAMLAENIALVGHPSALSTLETSLGSAGPEVMDIIHSVKTTTLPNINLAVAKAPGAVASLQNAGDNISGLLGDSKPDFRGTVANLHAITSDMKSKLPGMLDHIDTIVMKATTDLDNAKGTLQDLKASLANAKDVTATARSVVVDNRGKLDGIIASLKMTSDNLKNASAEVRRSPWRLLYQPGPGELANLQLYDAARQFADGANGVNDAAIALHDALRDPQVDKAQVQKLVDHLNATFTNFDAVEDKLWKAVRPE
jgi:ABC-type transporter Mla subunit MlaD